MAFIKGYFEGIDIAFLAEQYLDIGRDKRKARIERRWILDELIIAARQRGDVSAARLLKLPVGALPEDAPDNAAPQSLESFRDDVDPQGVYSEAELVALYQETRAQTVPSRQRARNARLRRRQRLLLDTLEASLVEPPCPAHRIGDWFEAAVVSRLEAVELDTIEKLIHYINRYGYRWYRRVPRMGEQTARRIQDWLRRHADDLALRVAPASELPRSAWSAAQRDAHRRTILEIAPIELFEPPSAAARADRDALLRVLSRHVSQPATYRVYRLQAERLLLWMSLVRTTSLSRLQAEDVEMFLRFASAPTPAHQWCGPKAERGTAHWRPFERAVSAAGLALARRILSSLCTALAKDGYLAVNPFQQPAASLAAVSKNGSPAPCAPAPRGPATQGLSTQKPATQKPSLLLDDLCALPGDDLRSLRMRVVFSLLRDTGLPLHAMTRLRVASLVNWPQTAPTARDESAPATGHVAPAPPFFGPATTATAISISPDTIAALGDYFHARGLDPTQPRNRDIPLIGRHIMSDAIGDASDLVPVTPNVLGRAIAAFIAATTTRSALLLASPAATLAASVTGVSFRSLRRQTKQGLHERSSDTKTTRRQAPACGERSQHNA
ncbi:MAG: phage integrase family protein [Janthinobacterium lividum]